MLVVPARQAHFAFLEAACVKACPVPARWLLRALYAKFITAEDTNCYLMDISNKISKQPQCEKGISKGLLIYMSNKSLNKYWTSNGHILDMNMRNLEAKLGLRLGTSV